MRSLRPRRSPGLQAASPAALQPAWPPARTRCRIAGGGSDRAAPRRAAGGAAGAGGSSGEDDALFDRALREAVEIHRRAQELAEQQARSELMQGWAADGGGADRGGGGPGGGGSPEPAPAAPAAVAAFFEEQGLGRAAAERLAARLLEAGAGPPGAATTGGGGGGGVTLERLQAKWLALQRVLPDGDLGDLVSREPGLLSASSGDLVGALVALVSAFPRRNVQGMIQARPGLMLLQDLPERCERTVAKLMSLHPSKDLEVVAGLIEENPELLVRMDYCMDARLLDELPVEIQTMMIPPGDMGIGWLYRHYASKGQQPQQP
ncbi:MAG: hypothetical protein J3K34DRAFT_279960 [Monoraphidium minutum]|nr:MAG: hypothetical protein J3K34DRAFT_279960 [Monoraphidium minutum]